MNVYTVSTGVNGPCLYASDDGAKAVHHAQTSADFDLATHPYGATPHYVITVWSSVGESHNDIHVYARSNSELNQTRKA